MLTVGGGAGIYTDTASVAPWTQPANEFVVPFGMYTALEFALIARRHMHTYGTTPEQLAEVAATIRNNGHVNPEAVYSGRGPFTPQDILDSRMVADPYHLLDCAITAEGGAALLLTTAERAADLRHPPVYVLGGGVDHMGPSYQHPPSFDLTGYRDRHAGQRLGRPASRASGRSRWAGSPPPTSTSPSSTTRSRSRSSASSRRSGSAGRARAARSSATGASAPAATCRSRPTAACCRSATAAGTVQLLQRVIRAVQQLQGTCATNQVAGAEVALASGGGAGALFNDVILLGSTRP